MVLFSSGADIALRSTAEKDRLIARFREAFDQPADLKNGKDQFEKQCALCHRFADKGRDFGPDLTDIRRKYDRATLLTHIRQPNLVVAPEHRTHSVTLLDDTELTGFLKKRTATELLLKLEDGTERRVPLTQVASNRESALSAMPEGLLTALTAQEVADLLEFLLSAK